MNRTNFVISYDGPALENHEMDVKDLAPALLALGELLEEANTILNGDRAKMAVNLRAIREGSVGVDLSLVQDLAAQLTTLFAGTGATGIVNLLFFCGLIKGQTKGLIQVIVWLRNRTIKNAVKLESGLIRLEIADESDSIEVPASVIKLLQNIKIRKSLEVVIKKPLERPGIDNIKFIADQQEGEEIEKNQAEYFTAPNLLEELIDEQEIATNLMMSNISFEEGNKWRFSDGTMTFFAVVQDEDFIKRVQMNEEAFAKDDILHVTLLRKQYRTPAGIRTEYFVKKILDHQSAVKQIQLPFTKERDVD